MFGWPAIAAFFTGKKGPYALALAAFVFVGYLAYIDISNVKFISITAFAGGVCIVYFLLNREPTSGQNQVVNKYYLKMHIDNRTEIIPFQEDIMQLADITADQKIIIDGWEGTDRTGGPSTTIENPVVTITTEGALAAGTNDEGATEISPLQQGTGQFRVDGDPLPGEPIGNIFQLFEVNVLPGVAKNFRPNFRIVQIEPTPTE